MTRCDDCRRPAVCWGPLILAAGTFRLCAQHATVLRHVESQDQHPDDACRPQPLYHVAADGTLTAQEYTVAAS